MSKPNALDDVILVGNKVYMRVPSQVAEKILEGRPSGALQARLSLEKKTVMVGDRIALSVELANQGKTPVTLMEIEDILPVNFELVDKPDFCHSIGSRLSMSNMKLNPSTREEIRLILRPLYRGTFALKPRVRYFNGDGTQRYSELDVETLEVSETVLPNRVKTGFDKLDSLLLGGIPQGYAVLLNSVACDERDLIVASFLDEGVKDGQSTLHVTVEARGVKDLAREHQSNFFLLICNPRADIIVGERLPNVFRLTGVENLTDITIALSTIFRRLQPSSENARRACIEIVSDVLLQYGAVHTRRWLTGLIPNLKSKGFTTLAVFNPHMHASQEVQAIPDLFDGEITIHESETGKFLHVSKMYNQRYLDSELPLRRPIPSPSPSGAILRRGM
jgi:uncharacterized repeat protein (TIGR01451 family)